MNLAIVFDGSASLSPDNFIISKELAKGTVAFFADENLFENGETASFVQFSSTVSYGGPFSSQEDFNTAIDAEIQLSNHTDIVAGMTRGVELLEDAPIAAGLFMVVVTDYVEPDYDPTVRLVARLGPAARKENRKESGRRPDSFLGSADPPSSKPTSVCMCWRERLFSLRLCPAKASPYSP